MKELIDYAKGLQQEMQELCRNLGTGRLRARVDTHILPVRVPGAWLLCCTQRTTHV